MEPNSTQNIFEQLLQLVGKEVELGTDQGKKFRGMISNVMFDSFLLASQGRQQVIRFNEIQYLYATVPDKVR